MNWGIIHSAKHAFGLLPYSMGQLSSRWHAGSLWAGMAGCQQGEAHGSGWWRRTTGQECTGFQLWRMEPRSRKRYVVGDQHHSSQSTDTHKYTDTHMYSYYTERPWVNICNHVNIPDSDVIIMVCVFVYCFCFFCYYLVYGHPYMLLYLYLNILTNHVS